jgi:hypothetical protein
MNELLYKGYVIEAVPKQLLDDDEWTIKINIWKHEVGSSEQIPFSASNTFAKEEEAIKQCFNFGKQIINGQIKLH